MSGKQKRKVGLSLENEGLGNSNRNPVRDSIRDSIRDSVRQGWNEAFRELHRNNDDHLLMDDVFDDEKFEEWENGD